MEQEQALRRRWARPSECYHAKENVNSVVQVLNDTVSSAEEMAQEEAKQARARREQKVLNDRIDKRWLLGEASPPSGWMLLSRS